MALRAAEQDRKDVARRRAQWMAHQHKVDAQRLVFIDETWARTNMAPRRGWGRRGTRLVGKAPHGRWHTQTFLAAAKPLINKQTAYKLKRTVAPPVKA